LFKVDHFAFEVSNLDESIKFYTEKLGLKLLLKKVDKSNHEAYAFLKLEGNGGNLELLQFVDEKNFAKKPLKQPYCPQIAFRTENMEEVMSMLEEKGLPIIKGPLLMQGHCSWVFTCDPDNNIIEFIQWFEDIPGHYSMDLV